MDLIIIKIAFRNIFLHRLNTLIVGSILIFGSFLAVLGISVVEAISSGMKNSITQSITGDIQIYSDKAKDILSIYGNLDGSPSDIGFVNDFEKIKINLMKEPNVKAIIPMGNNSALVNPGNLIDVRIEKLRKLYKQYPVNQKKIEELKNHLRFLIQDLQQDVLAARAANVLISTDLIVHAKEFVDQALQDAFWKDFDKHYESKLEFLANNIAPLIVDENILYFGYIGTDSLQFKKYFSQFEIVKGEMIPEGERGFLIHDYVYEHFVKNRIARRLDSIRKEIIENHKSISQSKELQDQIKASKEQLAEIYLSIAPDKRIEIIPEMRKLLNSNELDFKILLESFLDLNDENFVQRYQFFYDKIAPLIQLYKIQIGEVIPLSAFTKFGTSSAINVKVWGTFHFKSFENSPLAGNFSILDINSFRDLYGIQTESRKIQNKEIENEMGTQDLSEEELQSLFEENGRKTLHLDILKKAEDNSNVVEKDVFINAAIILNNPDLIDKTINNLNLISKKNNLGLKIVNWQSASGIIGQMTLALKLVLYFFVFVLFFVASLMIMNSLFMATMERQKEIGTMRAIGASKSFIYQIFLYESFVSSLLFMATMERQKEIGTMRAIGASKGFIYQIFLYESFVSSLLFTFIGSNLACLFILLVGKQGIPANGDVAKFFFSGPKLYFFIQWNSLGYVFLYIILISFLATQFPAMRAMQITPLLAMQKRD